MTNLLPFVASCTAGVLLGLIFFWGLWTTVNWLNHGHHITLLIVGSAILRFSLLLSGFYLVARYAGWGHVLSAALGFMLSRTLVLHHVRPSSSTKELGP